MFVMYCIQNVFTNMLQPLLQLTISVPLYSCNNNITLTMAIIAAEACW